jgi:hypothetical protein
MFHVSFQISKIKKKMSDEAATSNSCGEGALVKVPEEVVAATAENKAARYHNPYSISPVIKGRNYARSIVSSQEMMLENLRFIRRQLEQDDRKLEIFQKNLYLDQYPKKWTNCRQFEDREDNC